MGNLRLSSWRRQQHAEPSSILMRNYMHSCMHTMCNHACVRLCMRHSPGSLLVLPNRLRAAIALTGFLTNLIGI